MKKKYEKPTRATYALLRKTLRIMRITFFLVLFATMLTSAKSFSQHVKLNLDFKDITIRELFTVIEEQSDYRFAYSQSNLNSDEKVSIEVKNKSLDGVLSTILDSDRLSYEIIGRYVVITDSKNIQGNAQNGQEINITGIVTDSNGAPLPGVTVVIKGTANGTITGVDGQYAINNIPGDGTLVFSFVGMKSQEISIDGRFTINIMMEEDAIGLEEVVAVGYGTILKSNLSTSVGTVDNEALTERPTAQNLFQGLAGKVAGVNVALNSGEPGGAPVIKIRGIGSLNSSTNPLYVVDGVIGVDPQTIDPNIIKSVDILKDATSAAIYGARGANGVVVITTQGGEKNTSSISYSSVMSIGELANEVDVLNSSDLLEVYKRAYEHKPGRIAPHLDPSNTFERKDDIFNSDGTPKYDTDWQKEVTRSAISHQHSLTFSGGKDDLTVAANVSYKDNQGLMLETYRQQLNAFLNVSWDVKDWLNIKTVINTGNSNSRNSDWSISRYALEALPFLPVMYPDGTYSHKGDYPGAENTENPIKVLKDRVSVSERKYTLANIIGTFKITSDIKLTTSFSRQEGANLNSYYAPSTLFGFGDTQNGVATRSHLNSSSWTNEDYITIDKVWGDHQLNVVAGASWYYSENTSTSAEAWDFYDDFFQYYNMGVGAVRQSIGSNYTDSKMNSYYSRINYNYKNRYLLGASFREDGSSRFGINKQYGFFPSFSGAWRVSNEQFFERFKGSFIDDLKVRASYGLVGNAEIGDYVTMAQLQNGLIDFDKTQYPKVTLSNVENNDLSWEKSGQLDLAIDASFFNGRIQLIADYYRKITTDLLYQLQLPATTGYASTMTNLGKIQNKGIEITVNSRNVQTNNFLWSTNLVYSMNRSKVIDINGNKIGKWGGQIEEGHPINEFYGYVRLGTWGTDEEEEAAKYNKKPGDLKFLDKNDNGMKDGDDREYLGNGLPKFEMNISNSVAYKGFTFLLDLQWWYGNKVVNFTRQLMENRVTFSNAYGGILEDAWTPEHQDAMVVSLRLPGDGYENDIDSRSIEDGSFLRVRNVGLKYDFKSSLLSKANINTLSLSFNIENALLFTKYEGADPEVATFDAIFAQGVDVYSYPKPRVYSLSLGINF
ncbi:TonB-dependent receptor [Sunxiuqinia sp. A32]|uniref:TonB-dependent receptor n=1 Tax=Sunxiuqinia sp. A32 TaxID=3461496 RepID=UPI0040461ED0